MRHLYINLRRLPLLLIGVIVLAASYPSYAYAISSGQVNLYKQGILQFDLTPTQTCPANAGGTDYAGNPVLNSAQLTAIQENEPFYQKAADAAGIPWQVIAAIHGRETGFRRYGPANGYGPYQITPSNYPISTSYTDAEFQDATNKAADAIKAKAGGRNFSDINNIKYVMFAYNGMASAYINQAKSLGFSDSEAAQGEGSPYVMNRFDLKRDPTAEPTKSNNTWGQIKQDYGGIEYPANSDYGAFVYYLAIMGGSGCNVNVSAQNGDANAVLAEFASYMKSHNNQYKGYNLGINGCTTLSNWFIGEHTTLNYGRGNGKDVVGNLVRANLGKGLTVSDTPRAMSLYSVEGNLRTWGASGTTSAGHVGLVVSVDETKHTATVINTGSSGAGISNRGWVGTYSYPTNGVSFVYIGDYLK